MTAGFPVDVFETPDEVVVRAQLPGMKPEDVHVELQGDRLTISASRQPGVPRAAGMPGRETTGGEFVRSFSLGVPTRGDAIRAGYEGGVLTVRLPKAKAVRARRIPVEVGAS